MLALLGYKDQFLDRVSELINKAVALTMLRLHAERLADIALTEPESTGTMPRSDVAGFLPAAIELRQLSFRYSEHEPWIFENLNLRVEAGESVAIVGPSGGGKTTLLQVMAGILQPTRGQNICDSEPITPI